jgi:endonuclease YncB( thermonuclease family)
MEAPSGWTKLDGCNYLEGRHSDGDSVEVRHGGKHFVFRLYFVDCIEKNPNSTRRRAAQGHYFGINDEATALEVAHAATDFTRKALEKPFTVWTRWEPVSPNSDNPSIRAFIETHDGTDLAAELVGQGLAIIRGGQALSDHPAGPQRAEMLHNLRELETKARVAGRGAWGGHPPVTQLEASDPETVLPPTADEMLRSLAGREVRVRGTVSQVGSLPDNRITFVNFRGVPRGGFVGIIRSAALGQFLELFPSGLASIEGREIEISGPITLYRNGPQIELRSPSQLKVIAADAPSPTPLD